MALSAIRQPHLRRNRGGIGVGLLETGICRGGVSTSGQPTAGGVGDQQGFQFTIELRGL